MSESKVKVEEQREKHIASIANKLWKKLDNGNETSKEIELRNWYTAVIVSQMLQDDYKIVVW